MGGEQNTRVNLSPLQTLTTSKRRARTFPRDFLASVRDAVEPRTNQVKLGANHESHTHTLSQLVCELDGPEVQDCNGQPMPPSNNNPSLFKSKTADQARFQEKGNAYTSATDVAAHKGSQALGRCGLTATPITVNGVESCTIGL